jgi:hypothetical protein
LEGERTRGASTITQQLVKNLFFGTSRSILRKGAEVSLVPVAELVLQTAQSGEIPRRGRMGPGVYGESQRVVTTTKPRQGTSAGNRRHGSRSPAPDDDPARMLARLSRGWAKWAGNRG